MKKEYIARFFIAVFWLSHCSHTAFSVLRAISSARNRLYRLTVKNAGDVTIEKLGHEPGEWSVDREPTAEET